MSTEIKEYSQTEAALAELRNRYAGVKFDLTVADEDKKAREARRLLVGLRTSLEAKRKEIKAPALAYCNAIDAEAKRINGEILLIESPIDQQIKADEDRREAVKAQKAAAEAARVAEIREKISRFTNAPVKAVGKTAAQIAEAIERANQFEIGEAFGEFAAEAQQAKDICLMSLKDLHLKAVRQEEEAEKLAAERAELERQKAEREAAEKAEREQIEAKQRAEREAFDAEQKAARAKLEEEQRAAREKLEAQEREQQQRLAKEKAEHEAKIAAERAEVERQQLAAKQEREAAARAEAERLAKEKAEEDQVKRAAPAMLRALCLVQNHIDLLPDDVQIDVINAINMARGQ